MGNHQNKNVSKKFYRNEYELKDGQKVVVRNPELGDEQGLINQMKIVDSETKFLARECGEFNFTLEQEREFIKNSISMYESFGFQIYGTKKHALKYGDGTYADEYYMILLLNGINPA